MSLRRTPNQKSAVSSKITPQTTHPNLSDQMQNSTQYLAAKTATRKVRLIHRLQMGWYRLQSLDSQYYGSWPTAVKATIVGLLLLIIALVSYLLPIRTKLQQLKTLQQQQPVLLASYQQKRIQANTQQSYLQQTQHAKAQLEQMSAPLTTEIQITELMEAVNKLAASSGVLLQDMALAEEQRQETYILQPIGMVVVGGYHNFGRFLSGLSTLPRLLMVEGFAVSHRNPLQPDPQQLSLVLHTNLYRLKPDELLDSDSNSEKTLNSTGTETESSALTATSERKESP